MRRTSALLPCLLTGCSLFTQVDETKIPPEVAAPVARPAQQVMTWVSVWGIEEAQQMLDRSYGDVRVEDTLDRIGLQFWTVDAEGEVAFYPGGDAATTRWFVERGHRSGKRILGTIVNGNFDWSITQAALAGDGSEKVAEQLLALTREHELDGIDLDFETGGGVLPGDREVFATFVRTLAERLHAEGKLLTVDSFFAESNGAPGPLWWGDWLGSVDTIHVMGYDNTWWRGPGGAGYQALQDRAVALGFEASQLSLGLPAWVDQWGEAGPGAPSNVDNLRYIQSCLDEPTGVALWSLSDPLTRRLPDDSGTPWSSPEVWQALIDLHQGVVPDAAFCAKTHIDPRLVDDMSALGKNRAGGLWSAVSDYWSRPSADTALASHVLTAGGIYDMALGEGSWGKIGEGYEFEEERSVLSARFRTVALLGAAPAFAALHMEFLERDCQQLTDPADGCGWRPEALLDRDLTGYQQLVVGLRCEAGATLRLTLQSRASAIAYAAPPGLDIECSGEFADYELNFAQLGVPAAQLASLDIQFVDPAPPSEVAVTVLGIALDESVLSLRGLR